MGEYEYSTKDSGYSVRVGKETTTVRGLWTRVGGWRTGWSVTLSWGEAEWKDWEAAAGEEATARHAVEAALAALHGDDGPLPPSARAVVLDRGHVHHH